MSATNLALAQVPEAGEIMPASLEGLPPLASERQPEDFNVGDRVMTLYYRTWMGQPELVQGKVADVHVVESLDKPAYVNIKTPQTPDNRTGSIIGIDIKSVALMPEAVWPHLSDEYFLRAWVAKGAVAWPGERAMLERALRERIAEGDISWDDGSEPHDDAHGIHHPTRTRKHIRIVPGSYSGKVEAHRPFDYSSDNN
jgi:hypothetical protein